MKIIHTSDLHLGSKLTANLDANKSKQRKNEILTNFERLLSSASEQGVELVIIAGDLFDTENITKHVASEVISALQNNANVKVIYCVGNHESTAFIDNNDNLPNNFICISKTEWQTFKSSVKMWITIKSLGSSTAFTSIGKRSSSAYMVDTSYFFIVPIGTNCKRRGAASSSPVC